MYCLSRPASLFVGSSSSVAIVCSATTQTMDALPTKISLAERLSAITGLEYQIVWKVVFYSLSVILGWQLVQYLRLVFRSDLKHIPGPRWARLTAFWRPWVLRKGEAPEIYCDLHQKYGPLVRTAPGVVSVSDPKAIPIIYGIGTKFYKVSFAFYFGYLGAV